MQTINQNVLIEWVHTKTSSDSDQIIQRVSRTERILYAIYNDDGVLDEICVIDRNPDNKNAKPLIKPAQPYIEAIANGTARTTTKDKFARDLPAEFRQRSDETAQQAEKRQKSYLARDERWKIIEPIVSDIVTYSIPRERGKLLRAAAKLTGKTRKTIEKWCRWWLQGGMKKNALIAHYKGRSGAPGRSRQSDKKLGRPHKLQKFTEGDFGVNLTAKDKENFRSTIQQFLKDRKNGKKNNHGEPITLRDAFDRMLVEHYSTHSEYEFGYPIPQIIPREHRPSFERFRRFYYDYRESEQDYRRSISSRSGRTEFERNQRGLSGTKLEYGPGTQFQIDATIGDVYLVSSLNRQRIIGRPVIYLISDTFSHMIVSFAVTLEGPSWLGASKAIQNLAMNKVELCASLGIPISPSDWDIAGFPHTFVADNGEIASRYGKYLLDFLSVGKVILLPPYRPDWKGLVENDFKILNDEAIEWTPGHVYKRGERGAHDYRLDARFTLAEFRRLMVYYILRHNKKPIHSLKEDEFTLKSGVRPVPNDRWEWGMNKRIGSLANHDYEYVYRALLPRKRAWVTEYGIRHENIFYECATSVAKNWQSRARNQGRWGVDIAVDVRNPNNVYLCDNDGEILEPCWIAQNSKIFADYDWYEIRDKFAMDAIKEAQYEDEDTQDEITYTTIRQNLIDTLPPADFSDMSKREATKNISANRQHEKDLERAKDALHPTDDEIPESTDPQPADDELDDSASTVSKPSSKERDISFLRKNRSRKN